LNIASANTSPGGQVIIWDCVAGATNEIFSLQAVGVAGAISLYNGALCLAENSGVGAQGAALVTATCTGAAGQQWTLTAAGQLQHTSSGKCATPNGGGTANATLIVLASCTGGTSQQWIATGLTPTGPSTVLLQGSASGRCINIAYASTAPGGQVIIWDCVPGATNEIFSVQPAGVPGAVSLYNGALCLAETSGLGAEGASLATATCSGGPEQQWLYTTGGQIQHVTSGKCMTASGGAVANATPIVLSTCTTSTSQLWISTASTAVTGRVAGPAQSSQP
jgi:hypothetical protein